MLHTALHGKLIRWVQRDRQTDRDRDTDRQTDRQRQRDRQRQTETDRQTETERETHTHTDTDTDTDRQSQRDSLTETKQLTNRPADGRHTETKRRVKRQRDYVYSSALVWYVLPFRIFGKFWLFLCRVAAILTSPPLPNA